MQYGKSLLLTASMLTTCCVTSITHATSEQGWSGNASLGAVIASGNTDSQSVNAAFDLAKRNGKNVHHFFGNAYKAETNNTDDADRNELGYKFDRYFSQPLYWFARARYDSDDFANIDSRFSTVIGLGSTLLETKRQTVTAEGGVGTNSTKYLNVQGTPDQDIDTEGFATYLGLTYRAGISDNLTFNSNFFTELSINTLTVWDNNLQYSVSDKLSLSVGYLIRDNGDIVGSGGDDRDTTTMFNVVYGI